MTLGMTGNAKICVYDAGRSLVSETKADNVVLDYVTPVLEVIAGMMNEDDRTLPSTEFGNMARKFKGTNKLIDPEMFGIVGFKNTKAPTVKTTTSYEKPCLLGGNNSAATGILGSRNLSLTLPLKNASDNVIGQRFVWDFAAGSEIAGIKALALTSQDIASQVPLATVLTNDENVWANENQQIPLYFNNPPKRKNITLSKGAHIFTAEGNGMTYRKDKKIRITTTGISYTDPSDFSHMLTLTGYTDCYKILDLDARDEYVTIATNLATGNRELVRVTKSTGDFKTPINLSCLNAVTFYDFGLCGNFVVIMTTSLGSSTVTAVAKAVDMRTNTLSDIMLPASAPGDRFGYQLIITYTTIEGGYSCDIQYSSSTSSSSGTTWKEALVEVYEKADGTGLELTSYPALRTGGVGRTALDCFGGYPINFTTQISRTTYETFMNIMMARRTLFTLCNLPSPVTKGSTQTMQITYDLYWGPRD